MEVSERRQTPLSAGCLPKKPVLKIEMHAGTDESDLTMPFGCNYDR